MGFPSARLRLLQYIALFAVAFSVAKASPAKYQPGVLVEGRQYDPCHGDCAPFDRPILYFCVQVNNRILVGSRRANPVWMFDASKMFALTGHAISVRFNSRSLWIVRPDHKELHLRQDYSNDVFDNADCSREVRRHWLEKIAQISRPLNFPPEATLVPLNERSYFWVRCQFDPQKGWDRCTEWDSKGEKHPHDLELVDASSHRAVLDPALLIDPLSTRSNYEIHLTNGIVLTDWAKSRINDEPSKDSVPPVLPPE
jgi:hypothetical protein